MKNAMRALSIALGVILLVLSGCAIDPMEQLSQDIEAQELMVRQQAVLQLANLKDERAIDALVDVLQGDEELCDAAGVALVKKGREWPKKKRPNGVVEAVGRVAKNVNLLEKARARACWTLGEIGDREAVPILKGLQGDAKQAVKDQAKAALEKLGFFTVGRDYDIAWGELSGQVEVLKEPPPVVPEEAKPAEG
jgi:HEAT repeat protein